MVASKLNCLNQWKTCLIFRAFHNMCYTADGKCILAGGNAKNVCIYSVPDQILVKKFEITCNMSFDGTLVRAAKI